MNKQARKPLRLILILLAMIAGFWIRKINLPGLTTFDWDQDRDIRVISKIITGEKLTLIGPVVKSNKFFLGPVYYYISAIPLYVFKGHPIGLSYFTIFLDVLVGLGIYILLRKRLPFGLAYLALLYWQLSKYNIDNSHTPWNVSLILPWVVSVMHFFPEVIKNKKTSLLLFISFLLGLSTSIHLSIIPISVIAWVYLVYTLRPSLTTLTFSILAFAVPSLPLVIFDLRHTFTNFKLIRQFLSESTNKTSMIEFLPVFFTKLGDTVSRFLTGQKHTILGLLLYWYSLSYAYKYRAKDIYKTSLLFIITIPLLIIIYRDVDFADYYFIPLIVPLLLTIFAGFRNLLEGNRSGAFSITLLVLFFIFINAQNYFFGTQPFSLQTKQHIANHISQYNEVDLIIETPPGRGSGIKHLLQLRGVDVDPSHKLTAVVSESHVQAVLPDQSSLIEEKGFAGLKLTLYIVQ